MEMPPSMPNDGLNVRRASSSPSGTEMTTESPPSYPVSSHTACTALAIIWRGTRLMAAAPTGWSSPGFVTRPTPLPPSMAMPEAVFVTVATTRWPVVTSASSPPSL